MCALTAFVTVSLIAAFLIFVVLSFCRDQASFSAGPHLALSRLCTTNLKNS
jgi:hypothetical protein